MRDYLVLLTGLLCAAGGGELFVRGIVGLARWARVSAGIIGATFAAFATSSPELSVSITSALSQKPQIALGDALGSNVVNLALILGLALLMSPMHVARDSIRRDFLIALLVPVMLGVLGYDGELSRLDGILLLCVFALWLGAVMVEARRQRSAAGNVLGESRHMLAIVSCLGGLLLLAVSGKLIVAGAVGIALEYDIDPFVIGATLVAVGTSVPELATAIISRLKGHDEVGLGTLLGSNIFNGLFIVAVAAIIHPIALDRSEEATGLVFGMVATVAALPGRGGQLIRERGLILLALYAGYLGLMMQSG